MRPSPVRTVLLAGLTLAGATLCFADDLRQCGGYDVYLSVTPTQPGCDDIITLGATQSLSDSCWTAAAPVFTDDRPDFTYATASIDLWDSMPGCVSMILEIPFTRQVGPLPPGPYSLSVMHTSTSPRHGDSACSSRKLFDVTCCAELPPEATTLRVGEAGADTEVWLNWDDVPGADDYVIFGSDAADGPFTRQVQTAPSGLVGVGLPIESVPAFFVVGARNDCGVGPRR